MAQGAPPTYQDAINNPEKSFNPGSGADLGQPGYPPNPDPATVVVYPLAGYAESPQPPQQVYNTGYVNPNYAQEPTTVVDTMPIVAMSETLQGAQPDHGAEGFTTVGSFSDLSVRRIFIRKVFITLGLQLLFTFGIVCVFTLIDSVKEFVQYNPGLYYAAYAVFLVMYFVLVCSVTAARKHPYNLIMLILLTIALTYMVGTISSFYDIYAVLMGLAITVGVCLTVILFSMQTKFDFTKCGGLIFILLMVLVLYGFLTIFTWHYYWYVQVVYGALGALVFTLFLAFDVQLVMGGRKYELSPEEYIFGSLVLYIDIIYIFLFILAIFGGSSRS
ncbi:protein lifeguard 2-like isoform X1 [Clavelina lepadiformis]|uniref:protein lifeguard 2-like isoform X1 n=1 Tax=Clavelina lepadiformis TaxID=159417 RepID=UPI004041E2BD